MTLTEIIYKYVFPVIGVIIIFVGVRKAIYFFQTLQREAEPTGPTRDQAKAIAQKAKRERLLAQYAKIFVEMSRNPDGTVPEAKRELIMDFCRERLHYDAEHMVRFERVMQRTMQNPEDLDTLLFELTDQFSYKASLLTMELTLLLVHDHEPPSAEALRLHARVVEALKINTDDMRVLEKKYRYDQEHPGNQPPEEEKKEKITDVEYYSILNVPLDATFAAIKKAYRKLAMQYHPDHVAHQSDEFKKKAEEKMRLINEAYDHFEKKFGQRK